MKTKLLPRHLYEVYFIPRKAKRNSKRDIESYLKCNHPCYDPNTKINRKKRTIRGTKFDMITVLEQQRSTQSPHTFSLRKTTPAAIFSASSLAASNCVIHCPDETLYLDENPRSVLRITSSKTNSAETTDTNYQFNTDESIIEFAKKEKIHACLFFLENPSYRFAIAIAGIIIMIAGITLSFVHTKNIVPTSESSVNEAFIIHSPPVVQKTFSFWHFFTQELTALRNAGSKISSYSFDSNKNPSTTINLEKGSPEEVLEKLQSISYKNEVTIPSITYTGAIPTYIASFDTSSFNTSPLETSRADAPDINQAQTLNEIVNFHTFCSQKNYAISVIQTIPKTAYVLSLGNLQLQLFLPDVKTYCSSRHLDISVLQISRNTEYAIFNVAVQFIPEKHTFADAKISLTPELINKVFGILPKKTKQIDEQSKDLLIGKIEETGSHSIVFKKTDKGKTYIQGDITE